MEPVTLSQARDLHYPVIKTRRISLSHVDPLTLKIKIDYSINLVRPGRPNGDPLGEFMNHRAGHSTIKICFMVLDERSKTLMQDLVTPGKFRQTVQNLEADPRNAFLQETDGIQKVLLRDVITQSTDRINNTTAIDIGGATRYETHNTVEINYKMHRNSAIQGNPGLSIFSEEFSDLELGFLSSLHLVGFLEKPYDHLDNLSSLPADFKNTPITELTYDLLLEASGILRPPSQRQIFFVEDPSPKFESINLRPYSGPAFFDEDNGSWRAGLRKEDDGPVLSVRNVRNRKIIIDATPVVTPSSMMPFGPMPVMTQATGESLQGYVESMPGSSMFMNPELKIRKMVSKSIQACARNKSSFVSPWSRNVKWITKDNNASGQLNSSYNCVFGIQFFELIKQNSILGELIAHHQRIANSELEGSSEKSRAIVDLIYRKSKILNMTVTRRRLAERAYGHSPQDARTFLDFQENQVNKTIIETSDDESELNDFTVTGILPASLPGAEISEVEMSFFNNRAELGEENISSGTETYRGIQQASRETSYYMTKNKIIRSFLLRDYEIFYNLDSGRFTYDVELLIQDGVKKALEQYANTLRITLSNYSVWVKKLSIPRRPDETTGRELGYYDYYARRFRIGGSDGANNADRNPANDPVIFRQYVEALIPAVQSALFLMTAVDPFPGDTAEELKDKLDPTLPSTTLEDIEFFENRCKQVLASMESIMKDVFIRSDLEPRNNTKEVHVPNATGHNASIIRAVAKTGIIHNAEDTIKLMADYGIIFNNFLTDDLSTFIRSAQDRAAARALGRAADQIPTADLPRVFQDQDNSAGDFENPYGSPTLPVPPLTIDWDEDMFQPVEFSMVYARRLKLENTLKGIRVLQQDFDPSNSGTRRIPEGPPPPRYASGAPGHTMKITNKDFYSMSQTTRSIQELKIMKMMTEDSHRTGLASKGEEFDYSFMSSRVGGVMSKFGTSLASDSTKALSEAALKIAAVDNTYLSEEVKSAIVSSIVKVNDGQSFVDLIEQDFKQLTDIRDSLKSVFDIFTRLMGVRSLSVPSKIYNQTAKDEYLSGKTRDKSAPQIQLDKDPFKAKQGKLVTFTETGETQIRPSTAAMKDLSKNRNVGSTGIKKVEFYKIDVLEGGDNIAKVNNAMLLEIK